MKNKYYFTYTFNNIQYNDGLIKFINDKDFGSYIKISLVGGEEVYTLDYMGTQGGLCLLLVKSEVDSTFLTYQEFGSYLSQDIYNNLKKILSYLPGNSGENVFEIIKKKKYFPEMKINNN